MNNAWKQKSPCLSAVKDNAAFLGMGLSDIPLHLVVWWAVSQKISLGLLGMGPSAGSYSQPFLTTTNPRVTSKFHCMCRRLPGSTLHIFLSRLTFLYILHTPPLYIYLQACFVSLWGCTSIRPKADSSLSFPPIRQFFWLIPFIPTLHSGPRAAFSELVDWRFHFWHPPPPECSSSTFMYWKYCLLFPTYFTPAPFRAFWV